MKRLLIAVFIVISAPCFAQYNLGKAEKHIRELHKGDSLVTEKVDDSLYRLHVLLTGLNRFYYIGKYEDSCVLELVVFTDVRAQEKYMKELNEKWINDGDQKWKMYFEGTTVFAVFDRIDNTEYDAVWYFRLK